MWYWDPADARKVPVNAKDRVAKNIEEGRSIKFGKLGGGELENLILHLQMRCGEQQLKF